MEGSRGRMAVDRHDRHAAALRRAVVPARHGGSHSSTVSRSAEVETVARAIGSGRCALVFGEVGVGKTYVVDAAQRLLSESEPDLEWLMVSADPDDGSALAALSVVLPELLAAPADMEDPMRTAMAYAVLRARAQGRRLVVRVEDAHHLDAMSRHVLVGLARTGEIGLVATLRPGVARRAPWVQLWKDGVAERIDVARFTPAETERYVAETLGGDVAADVAIVLWNRTGGNPLFVRELTRVAVESRALLAVGSTWVWDRWALLDPRVLDLVQHELVGLSAAERLLLEQVVALGGALPSVVDALDVSGAYVALVADRLLEVVPVRSDGPVTVPACVRAHPLVAEALRGSVPARVRREAVARWEELTGGVAASDEALVRMVTDALEVGDAQPMPRILEATTAALREHRCELVVRLVGLALPGARGADVVRLLATRASAHRFLSRPDAARRDLVTARDLVARLDLTVAEGPELFSLLGHLEAEVRQFAEDDADGALEVLALLRDEVGVRWPDAPATWWQDEEICRLTCLAAAGRHAEPMAAAEELFAATARRPHAVLPLVPSLVAGAAQMPGGHGALGLVERFMGVATAHADSASWAVSNLATAGFVASGLLGYVMSAGDVEKLLGATDLPFNVDVVALNLLHGITAMQAGDWPVARARLAAASRRYEHGDVQGRLAVTYALGAIAAAASGEVVEARELLERARTVSWSGVRTLGGYMGLLRLDALAWLRDRALVPEALALAETCRGAGLVRVEFEALHRAVVTAHPAGGTLLPGEEVEALGERALAIAPLLDGPRAAAVAAHLEAVLAGDDALALSAVRDMAAAGLFVPTAAPAVQLTRRESQIAALAAAGLSSKEIAERLTLSVRTVDSHLSRIFAKAGVRSRRELAAALHLDPTP
ncbi:LuxR family transcriptional regulator [Sanguibacter sp. HDW7]|uniref:helix-turn-helix transcriptional regulator n=1 Tax=Sanguibacter sp. HDW7 TaxID=2714931 RepID=UPI0014098C75|nr:LuxR family transcriptional regulator [Sanguibacter sp. HDW7]QIK83068.1 hypothetical protein G7063_05060 [Sanguibacter sp. HDW7]